MNLETRKPGIKTEHEFFQIFSWIPGFQIKCTLSVQPILIKPLVALAAALVNFAEALWYLIARRTVRLERGRVCHLGIPMFGPDPVGLTQPWWPREHRLAKLDAYCVAQQPQYSFRIFKYVFRINDRWSRIRAIADKIKNLRLLRKAEVLQRGVLELLDI